MEVLLYTVESMLLSGNNSLKLADRLTPPHDANVAKVAIEFVRIRSPFDSGSLTVQSNAETS